MELNLVVAVFGVVISFLIVYQNYIQNAPTQREIEQDLRGKILGSDSGKGREGEIFSVVITDLRVIESQSCSYKLRRLLTRGFRGDTQLDIEAKGPVVDETTLDGLSELLKSEYSFDISISYIESEDKYKFVLNTIDESDIVECVMDFQNTVDENVSEGNWERKN